MYEVQPLKLIGREKGSNPFAKEGTHCFRPIPFGDFIEHGLYGHAHGPRWPIQGAHLVLVYIHLEKHHVGQLLAKLLNRRSDLLARRAPRCREVDAHQRVSAVRDYFFELCLCCNLLHLQSVFWAAVSTAPARSFY